ncbi:MAG TPA: quinol:electron acceptor oxidoreductase subunit ActD [Bryobacterales bacterium]|nr:quinol:electron acceptor oxidoreductase subunit ActD [Bryobacterales bacterium]
MYLTGEFTEARSVAAAIEELRSKGFEAAAFDVFSNKPVELPPGLLDRRSRMSLATVGGGVLLCLLTTGFVYYTQHSLRIVTGGMPLFSFWATGVVFYELTMLGAIAATFVMFLWESGLLERLQKARQPAAPVPVVAAGAVCLRVQCEPGQVATAGECLYRTGAVSVKKAEKAP